MMIGQLGEVAVAGVGFAGRYVSLALTVINAAATGAGIFAAQYEGQHDHQALCRSVSRIFWIAMAFALIFIIPALICLQALMAFYTEQQAVQQQAVVYLLIYIGSLVFSVITSLCAVLFRTCEYPQIPLWISAGGILANTGLNALLIFGFGWKAAGAAWASLISTAGMALASGILLRKKLSWFHLQKPEVHSSIRLWNVLGPLLATEFFWGLGETIYAAVYGRTGLAGSAAMTMTVPLQSMVIGMLSGFSQAAGILVGGQLGAGHRDQAYEDAKKLIRYSLFGSIGLAILLILLAPVYVGFFAVSSEVKTLCIQLLIAFALFSIVKVLNMVAAGGILRSGGNTKLVLGIDLLGTWGFGVPLALLGLWMGGSIVQIYAMLSMEEVIRLVLTLILFKRKKWMRTIQAEPEPAI